MLGKSISIPAKRKVVPVSREFVGKNSTTFTDGEPVKIVAGVATPAGVTGEYAGYAIVDRQTPKAFASGNESAADGVKEFLLVALASPENERVMATDGTLATVGRFYKFDSAKKVDVSEGAQTTDAQVEVTEVISADFVKVRALQSK